MEKSIRNKKAKRLNLLKGSQSHIPSQTNGNANVLINTETTIKKEVSTKILRVLH